MALDTWTPPKAPHVGTGTQPDQRILEANFGDGYVQTAEDGLNAVSDSATLNWSNLEQSDYEAIVAFYRLKGRATPFLYTLPFESNPKQWRFSGPMSHSVSAQILHTISLPIRQTFDLG